MGGGSARWQRWAWGNDLGRGAARTFAVTGAEKALSYGHNAQVAVLLGITIAVGVLRDVMLNRVPVILQKEIYASAALIGASVVVLGNYLAWVLSDWVSLIGLTRVFLVEILFELSSSAKGHRTEIF